MAVVRRLKNDAQTGHIPIIGMSAYAVTSERQKAIATGCDGFEAKPIEFESLVATIRRVVANPKDIEVFHARFLALRQANTVAMHNFCCQFRPGLRAASAVAPNISTQPSTRTTQSMPIL